MLPRIIHTPLQFISTHQHPYRRPALIPSARGPAFGLATVAEQKEKEVTLQQSSGEGGKNFVEELSILNVSIDV
jgi:hypothetical protein